jgi:hypothetical protein
MTDGNFLPTGVTPRAIFIHLPGSEDPRIAVPLAVGDVNGVQWRRLRPGRDLEQPTVKIAWIVTIDDRVPEAVGPDSFDHDTLTWLFKDAYRIAVDTAEPRQAFYEHIVDKAYKGERILVIHTVEARRLAWREFARTHCELYGVLELIADPDQRVRVSVARFEGRTPAAA